MNLLPMIALASVGFDAAATVGSHPSIRRIESDLARLSTELSKHKDQQPEFIEIHAAAEGALEAMKLPSEFKVLNQRLNAKLKAHQFGAAADVADKMAALLPREHSIEYPLSEDFNIVWRADVGDLRTYACDYKAAAKDYEAALKMTGVSGRPALTKEAGKSQAAYGLARVYAILGRKSEALKQLGDAPGYYWSGCGNCMESDAEIGHRLATVWSDANLPYAKAKVALAAIVAGHYKSRRMQYDKGCEPEFELCARVEAAFALGEISLRHKDKGLAKQCFFAVSHSDEDDLKRMALSRLQSL